MVPVVGEAPAMPIENWVRSATSSGGNGAWTGAIGEVAVAAAGGVESSTESEHRKMLGEDVTFGRGSLVCGEVGDGFGGGVINLQAMWGLVGADDICIGCGNSVNESIR
jgi:hypothetical protein